MLMTSQISSDYLDKVFDSSSIVHNTEDFFFQLRNLIMRVVFMMVGEFVEQSFIGGSWKTDDMKMKH